VTSPSAKSARAVPGRVCYIITTRRGLDGGGSRPLQRKAIELLQPANAMAETKAIHAEFGKKRARMLNGLRDLGLHIDLPPEGTFYVWASAQHLPASISDGMSFFRAALERKVITVPGQFFDVDPGKRRGGRVSRFHRHLRFSFGPPMARLETALERLGEMIATAS